MLWLLKSFPGQAQIRSLTKKIEDRERAAAKVEKSIKVARVGSSDTQRELAAPTASANPGCSTEHYKAPQGATGHYRPLQAGPGFADVLTAFFSG